MAAAVCINRLCSLHQLFMNSVNGKAVILNTRASQKLLRDFSIIGHVKLTNGAPNTLIQPREEKTSTSLVILSDSCVARIKNIQTENEYLRIAVDGGGCSGFQYTFNMDRAVNADDRVFERDGAKIIVDETSLAFLKGSTIDFQEELIRSSFRVKQNPNADHGCSCGASFSVKA